MAPTRCLIIFVVMMAIKILLIPSYFSTDFEVHRNWLAITHSLPLTQWYHDTSSENATLDYPPFFAFFEKLLSFIGCNSFWAKFEHGINDNSTTTTSTFFGNEPIWCHVQRGVHVQTLPLIIFQRLTVIFISDFIYFLACVCWVSGNENEFLKKHFQLILLYGCPGLIIVDNIHFQYNGILFGIFLFSLLALRNERYILSGILYSVLLNMKHLNLYMAPAYFLFLLLNYCLESRGSIIGFLSRISRLGLSVIGIFVLSFGPFLLSSARSTTMDPLVAMKMELNQILSRLFPFERGLTHAYWAPNFWALYNTADKMLAVLFGKVLKMVKLEEGQTASLTGGLVGLNQGTHTILPTISPRITIVLCLLFSFTLCAYCFIEARFNQRRRRSNIQTMLLAITNSVFAFFMFGWHVHEKAILSALIPLAILVTISTHNFENHFKLFAFTSIVGTYSLFPLLFQPRELLVRWFLLISFFQIIRYIWNATTRPTSTIDSKAPSLFSLTEALFLYGLIFIELYQSCIHNLIFQDRLPFLPLMMISFYCSLGLHYAWSKIIITTISHDDSVRKEKIN
ncbi:hypothetical protein C9374_003743 [Naegleria lovaniensis]|uniref:Alpha-1,3-glucosyltransferase n=1 Tax=Naegleria lovaniensis TaxID=51637 RepID=A0AA88H5U2_NAELO|nr:uncharacterized protein C9374_003743 [Naegleria lovaniensis]KAG2393979.1 hypothetical protein C9374_003743 [Naegleria lovaniensis]